MRKINLDSIRNISLQDNRLKLLVALGGCIVMTIFFVLMFGFEVKPLNQSHKKVGYFNIGKVEEPGWSNEHYKGLKAACDEFDLELLTRNDIQENSGQAIETIEELEDEDAGIIFMMSYNYPLEAKNLIESKKNIEFVANSSEISYRNFTGGFARMYQGRYLAGALAGMRTKSNVIGYVAAMPVTEVIRGINAFTLGVQRTNPKAKVLVVWIGSWRNDGVEAAKTLNLVSRGRADVITYHVDFYKAIADTCEELGIDFIGYNLKLEGYGQHYLTSVMCNWELFYREILRLYLKKELSTVKNYWIGIKQGAVTLSDYSDSVTQEQRDRIEFLRQELINSKKIFVGPIYDGNNKLRCAEGETISEHVLLERIDWFVKGVEFLE